MARMDIDKNYYYDEEDSISEKIREDLIQLIRSSKKNIIDDSILLSELLRKRNDYFWLKGEKNKGLIDWNEKDVKTLDRLIKFTEKGKLRFFG